MSKKPKAHNLVDPDLRNLFLVHRDKYAVLKKKMDDASNTLRTYVKTIKGDGFSVMQIKDAIWMSTPEGEAEFKAEMANRMLAAAYIGADIGEQLSLFLDHNRTPLIDRAYKEGQAAAMRNEAAVPKYDPSTEAYRTFMSGYQDEQARQVKSGIGKLDAKAAAANKAGKNGKGAKSPKAAKTAKAAPAKPAGKRGRPPGPAKAKPADSPPRRPSAAPVTRAGLAAAKVSAPAETEDSYFSRSSDTKGSA